MKEKGFWGFGVLFCWTSWFRGTLVSSTWSHSSRQGGIYFGGWDFQWLVASPHCWSLWHWGSSLWALATLPVHFCLSFPCGISCLLFDPLSWGRCSTPATSHDFIVVRVRRSPSQCHCCFLHCRCYCRPLDFAVALAVHHAFLSLSSFSCVENLFWLFSPHFVVDAHSLILSH